MTRGQCGWLSLHCQGLSPFTTSPAYPGAPERTAHKSPVDAIFQACLLRFRPITMTTMAALLGGLPLALGTGTGAELRRPLGITIVGGLIFSQMLTLYTTPVVYLYLDHLQHWCTRLRQGRQRPQVARLESSCRPGGSGDTHA